MDLFARVEGAAVGAEQDAQAGFFQDLDVVVVGVAHGPSGTVSPGFLAIGPVHQSHVTVHPVVEMVVSTHLNVIKTIDVLLFLNFVKLKKKKFNFLIFFFITTWMRLNHLNGIIYIIKS